ncbi:unnamed protein product [Cylicostephanus goldi]|uniref:Xylose isomerase-like TIM barrel domain-containing protein n=1 Tax=Cylicostephanus goldi TaxID=71465 RepID=A0A3P7N1E0_CYLGO|nr:unnamed protein product [Cylicostephanus goldi]
MEVELIGYIQVAQVPSRDEPSTPGEIDYKYVFEMLKSANPDWTIGLEHNFNESHGSPKDWIQNLGLSM